jgi:hypothetical protein
MWFLGFVALVILKFAGRIKIPWLLIFMPILVPLGMYAAAFACFYAYLEWFR